MSWYDYDLWKPTDLSNWIGGTTPTHSHELDPHLDIGCGTIKKARIGIDRYWAPGVNVIADLDPVYVRAHAPSPNSDECLPAGPFGYRPPRGSFFPETFSVSGRLPFKDDSIESAISHHALEHIGEGFVALIDEIYRVLKPGAIFRAITPLFPSRVAVEDPDHCRYFVCGDNFCTWDAFCGEPHVGGHWHEGFSVPYTKARFKLVDRDYTPRVSVEEHWGASDVRELRVSLQTMK